MFTGIIETIGTLINIQDMGGLRHFEIASGITGELKADQSVAHEGVCLTVTGISDNNYTVTAVQETLDKTNLKEWQNGRPVNIERAMLSGSRLDGHIVQGHVDTTAICTHIDTSGENRLYHFQFDRTFAPLIIEKGSVCINGVSLTAFNVQENTFTVTIIPYTFVHTTFRYLQENDKVNVEFDLIGKYILRNSTLAK